MRNTAIWSKWGYYEIEQKWFTDKSLTVTLVEEARMSISKKREMERQMSDSERDTFRASRKMAKLLLGLYVESLITASDGNEDELRAKTIELHKARFPQRAQTQSAADAPLDTKVRAALATEGAIPTTFASPNPQRQTGDGEGDTIVPAPVFGRLPRPDASAGGQAGGNSATEPTGKPSAGSGSGVAQMAQVALWQATVESRQEAEFANQAAMATRVAIMEASMNTKMSEISSTLALLMQQLNPQPSLPRKGKAESRKDRGGSYSVPGEEEEEVNMDEQGNSSEGVKWQLQSSGRGGRGSKKKDKNDKNVQ